MRVKLPELMHRPTRCHKSKLRSKKQSRIKHFINEGLYYYTTERERKQAEKAVREVNKCQR